MEETRTWKCEVCGYIHTGPRPPEHCPVCGADASMFSPFVAVTERVPDPTATSWRCGVCGYIHQGDEPPDKCPVCGADKSLFQPLGGQARVEKHTDVERVVIVGGGVAALTAAEHARQAAPSVEIRVVSREAGLPYYRLNLTRFLAGEVEPESLPLKPAAWYDDHRVDLIQGDVVQIQPGSRNVKLRDGRVFPYDRLVLANGAHAFVPPIPGVQRDGVTVFRTLDDARRIVSLTAPGARCLCIGGGLLGLETAGALKRRGAEVQLVEGHGWLLPRQLPERAGRMLRDFVESQGITVHGGTGVQEVVGDEVARGVALRDGREVPADCIVLSTGVRPNSYLARQCALKVGSGVIVDDRMFTSDPRILACGDVAEHQGMVYGIWPASYAQGVVAGTNAVGGAAEFARMPPSNRLKVLDVDIYSVGQVTAGDASTSVYEEEGDGTCFCLVSRDGRLTGAALYGDTTHAGLVREAVEGGRQIHEQPALLEAFPCLMGECREVA